MWAQYDHVLPHTRGGTSELGGVPKFCDPKVVAEAEGRVRPAIRRSALRRAREFDQRCVCIATSSPKRSGSRFNHSFGARLGHAASAVTASSSMQCSGGRRQAFPGATSRSASVRGRPSTTAFPGGRREVSGNASSRSCRSTSMTSVRSSTRLSSGPTRMPRAEKGGPMQCSGQFSRRFFLENPRRSDHDGQAARSHADARSATRLDGSGAPASLRARQGRHC